MAGDVVTLETDPQPGEPLLIPVMRGGVRVAPLPDLAAVRRHAADNLAQLPEPLRHLEAFEYPVEIAPALHELVAQVDSSTLSCHSA